MNNYINKLTLDLNCNKSAPKINSAQFDKGRVIEISVVSDGEIFDISECSAIIKGVRSDKSYFALECIVDRNIAIATIDDTTLSVRGLTVAKLVISDNTKTYSTQSFIIDVDSSLDGNITNDDNFSILNRMLQQMHALNEHGAVLVDDTLDESSENPVQNKVVATLFKNINLRIDNGDGGGSESVLNAVTTLQGEVSEHTTVISNLQSITESNTTQIEQQAIIIENHTTQIANIKTDYQSIEGDIVEIVLNHNTSYSCGTVDELSIEVNSTDPLYISEITFTSGESATMMMYSTIIFSGTDTEDGDFIPANNTRYDIVFWIDNGITQAVVRGVSSELFTIEETSDT